MERTIGDDFHDGGCLCGGVRYRTVGRPLACSVCHCVSCRGATGAQSVAWLVFPAGRFSFVSGAPTEHRSSAAVSRTFCAACGTTLTYQHDDDQNGSIDVTAASLDDPELFPPTRHIWLEDRLSWESVNDGLPRFQRDSSSGQPP